MATAGVAKLSYSVLRRCVASGFMHRPVFTPSANAYILGLSRMVSSSSSCLVDRRYTKDHEWISLDGSIGKVGITHYAQDKLGEIVYVELPSVDTEFEAEDVVGAVESVKAASDLIAPVAGKVIEVNEAVEAKTSLLNSSPYGDGWLYKLKVKSTTQVNDLMDEAAYKKFLEQES